MNGMMLMPYRPERDLFDPTPGGLLDGLPELQHASGLELLLSPHEVAGIDGLGTGGRGVLAMQESEPMPRDVRDNNPETEAGRAPAGRTDQDRESIAGKAWNLPNTVVGLGVGGLGYLAGWPSKWMGLQENAPGITIGNNAVQFTDNPFGGVGAITLGNVEVINGQPTDRVKGIPIGQHEEQHTYQGEQLGPLYLPSNIFGGLAGELIDGNWHGPHNWNEAGPQQNPPVPWPK